MKAFGNSNPEIAQWTLDVFGALDETLELANNAVKEAGLPPIQISPLDGRILEILARMVQPKKIVEIGTLGGFSGICLARALEPGGTLFTFELYEKNAEVARRVFRKSGVSDKIQILQGPALEKLPEIESEGPFDVVFIDADKVAYPDYFDWAAKNLRVGGILLGDNTFAWGNLARKDLDDENVEKIREFNRKIANHPDFRAIILPTGEGLTLGLKIK